MTQSLSEITVSAPGSIMITGEHAVVYGHRAIVAAIAQRITVTLRRRDDGRVTIRSEIAPPFDAPVDGLATDGPYRFVLAAFAAYAHLLPLGCDLEIRSDIDPTLGLGSSAAVTVATLGALAHITETVDLIRLHQEAVTIVRSLQGRGSGADLAASLYGGLVAYKAPEAVTDTAGIAALALPETSVSLRYCGYKTPTAEVLHMIAERQQGNEATFADLYARMGQVAEEAIAAAGASDSGFYDALKSYQSLMEELGVSDETLDQIIADAYGAPETRVAKISGSGLGDCVVAFGPTPPGFTPVTISEKGLIAHG